MSTTPRSSPVLRLLLVIFLAALVITIAWWFLWPRSADPQQLAQDYFEPYNDRLTQLNDDHIGPVDQAMIHYNEGHYQDALNAFQQLPDDLRGGGLVQLYTGIAALGAGEAELAVTTFEQLITANGPTAEEARWYLALAYLATQRTNTAAATLETIVETASEHAVEAAELLDRL